MSYLSRIAPFAVGLVFAIAAGAKLGSPDSVIKTLLWIGVPTTVVSTFLFALVIVEVGLAFALIYFPTSARVRQMGIVLLALFTLLLVWLVFHSESPSCGCLGLLYEFQSTQNEQLSGIARNLLLCAALSWAPANRTTSAEHLAIPTIQ